jgi:hypothetical protein
VSDEKSTREQLTEIAEAVREIADNEVAEEVRKLRAEVEALRATRELHHCHGLCCTHVHCNWGHCNCWTVHYPVPGTVTSPVWITNVGSTSAGSIDCTSVAAGVPQIVTYS